MLSEYTSVLVSHALAVVGSNIDLRSQLCTEDNDAAALSDQSGVVACDSSITREAQQEAEQDGQQASVARQKGRSQLFRMLLK